VQDREGSEVRKEGEESEENEKSEENIETAHGEAHRKNGRPQKTASAFKMTLRASAGKNLAALRGGQKKARFCLRQRRCVNCGQAPA
jgi:hypothetical protein